MTTPKTRVSNTTAQKTQKLKNVLVLYSHNASADYLGSQPLAGVTSMGPNLSSWDDDSGAIDTHYLEALQSPDGIQFHHFKRKVITDNPEDDRTIAPCINALEQYIAGRKEKLDAIVVTAPYGTNYEDAETIQWLSDMKRRFPGVKILVNGYWPRAIDVERVPEERKADYIAIEFGRIFAIPNAPEHEIKNTQQKLVITPDNPNYTLAPPIDMMPVNTSSSEIPNQLRALLGMPPYKEQAKGPLR